MTTHIALFRSLNVGGKNVIKMAALTALFAKSGAKKARAYIQSGNVLFESERPESVMKGVLKMLLEEHAITVPATLRSADELRDALARNPFQSHDAKLVQVMFLGEPVSLKAAANVDLLRSPPDLFHVTAETREAYLCCPHGIAKTKYTNAYLDKALGSMSTGRNIHTVQALLALASV